MARGDVKVEEFKGRLRLRFSVSGKPYTLSLRLDDTVINRRIAEGKAGAIHLDILSGNFDPTLQKYKPKTYLAEQPRKVKKLTLQELWSEYMTERESSLAVRTLRDKFKAIQTRVNEFGKDIKTEADAIALKAYLERFNKPRQVLDKLTDISAAYKWGISQGFADTNYFEKIKEQITVEPIQESRPFTVSEVKAILDAFQDPKYSHYYDFVQFLFLTGCRTGEAIGLKWKHISKDFNEIWIGESITRGVKKSTKTNKARIFPCNPQIKTLLENRFNNHADISLSELEESLVFTSPSGKCIDDKNFTSRVWKPLLKEIGVKYRSQYKTRHTFISHMLANKMEPLEVSKITGHDVKTLLSRYANIISRVEVPELY